MKWLMAASEEILSGARKAMTELDLKSRKIRPAYLGF
jgi:hypothetical protein